jgi:hypothetical protein
MASDGEKLQTIGGAGRGAVGRDPLTLSLSMPSSRPALLHPAVSLALSAERLRDLAAALPLPRALLRHEAGTLALARALWETRLPDAACDLLALVGRIASKAARRAAVDCAHDVPEIDAHGFADEPPADLSALLVARHARGDDAATRLLDRVRICLGRKVPSPTSHERILRAPHRFSAAVLAKGLAAAAHGAPWVVEEDGVLHAALLWSEGREPVLEPDAKGGVRRRVVRALRADVLRAELETGRITLTTPSPDRVALLEGAIAQRGFGDPRAFAERPAFTLRALLELGDEGLRKVPPPDGVKRMTVVHCELVATEQRGGGHGPHALAEAALHAQKYGGYLGSVALRFEVEGARFPVDVYIELPNQIALHEPRFAPIVRAALSRLGILSPGSTEDDVVSLAPLVHPEWRWCEVARRDGFLRMVDAGVLRKEDPRRTRRVASEAMRAFGYTLRTFDLPHPEDHGRQFALADDPSMRGRTVGEAERTVWRLHVPALQGLLRRELGLAEGGKVELPAGVLDLGARAEVRAFYVMTAVTGEAEKRRMERALAAAAKPGRAVVFAPRGKMPGGDVIEIDVREQLGAASWEGKLGDAGEHAAQSAAREALAGIRLDVDGGFTKGRWHAAVNGLRAELQHARFVFLVRAVALRLKKPGAWSSKSELGIARSPEVPSRIQEAFAAVLPPKMKIIESDNKHNVRLNPLVEIGHVAWDVLEGHGTEEVRKVAREILAWAKSGGGK